MSDQKELSEKALATKLAAEGEAAHLEMQTPTPGDGPIHKMNPDAPVMGALDAEGHRPVLERSRKVR